MYVEIDPKLPENLGHVSRCMAEASIYKKMRFKVDGIARFECYVGGRQSYYILEMLRGANPGSEVTYEIVPGTSVCLKEWLNPDGTPTPEYAAKCAEMQAAYGKKE